jgi:3-hydroxyisobutyrate dehydrogenase-like beta-hydroxyacid dehydrogenase
MNQNLQQHVAPEPPAVLGFIGLGAMGWAMCRHLQQAGHALQVYARDPAKRERAAAAGMRVCASPAEAVRGAQALFSNVTSTPDVEQVLLGPQGAVHGAAPGLLCIDHSTIAPAGARAVAQALAARGIDFLDAPVSGGEQGARDATLSIMVGGDAAAFTRALPLLRLLGSRVTHVGASGNGQVAKLCNQIVQVINIEGIAEALRFAAAEGADLGKVLEAISAGMAGSRMLDLMGPKMAARDFAAGIQSRLHAKDFGLAVAAAAQAGLELPALAAVQRQLDELMRRDLGRLDTSALLTLL